MEGFLSAHVTREVASSPLKRPASLYSPLTNYPFAFTLLGMITMCINCAVLELHDLVSRVANPGPAPASPTQSYVECILATYGNVVIANELKFSFMLIDTMF